MLKDLRKDVEADRKETKEENTAVAEFVEESKKFKEISSKIAKKGQGREEQVKADFVLHYWMSY